VSFKTAMQRLVQLATLGLIAAAVAQELRKPPRKRKWRGTVAGVVPYDLRFPPTVDRVKQAIWNPKGSVLQPQAFGVGWTFNLGRLVAKLGLG
jgi:hypothetical protein